MSIVMELPPDAFVSNHVLVVGHTVLAAVLRPGCVKRKISVELAHRGGTKMEAMQAAVFRQPHQPLTIEAVDIDRPGPRELLVRTAATGVCHSDLHLVEGNARFPLGEPYVLGHEGSGVVEAVGEDVTYVKPGDHVVACLSGFCGMCEQCLAGHPNLCTGGITGRQAAAAPRLSQQGQPVVQGFGIASYAERMLLHENSVVRIDSEIPLDRAALVGCGVLTGVGAALRTAAVRAGQTVAVFGCGGVGLSIIQGARIAGARQIIGVDRFDSKLEMASEIGATHTVNSTRSDPVQTIRELTRKAGVDHAFEAVGNPTLVRQAIESLAIRGTATIVGVLPPDANIEFPWMAIRPECKVQTSRMGSNQFRVDIPNYLELYRQGRLHLDEMISARRPLADINDAFRAMNAGEVARTVLTFN
jgi:S-(hydroxymethyl)glutathione dehydrogenase / alcohol dehydrogenase